MAKDSPQRQMSVSAVTEDYLKALWSAETRGQGLSVNQIAQKMGVVASTASENVARLKAQGLVEHEPYRKVHLSDEGRCVAVGMIRRHRILETYLHHELGFEWDEVHEEAEALEHAVSDRLLARLERVLGYPQRDPHGDPIPLEDGSWYAPKTRPLSTLDVGESAHVGRISDRSSQILRDLEKLGITLDIQLTVKDRYDDGAMELLIGEDMNGNSLRLSSQHVPVVEVVDERVNL